MAHKDDAIVRVIITTEEIPAVREECGRCGFVLLCHRFMTATVRGKTEHGAHVCDNCWPDVERQMEKNATEKKVDTGS